MAHQINWLTASSSVFGDARGQLNIRALPVLYRRQNGELDILLGIL
jgi:hypothetical protein